MAILQSAKPISSTVSEDEELNRNYVSKFQVIIEQTDSPFLAMQAPGLPLRIDPYIWGSDIDIFASIRTINVSDGEDMMFDNVKASKRIVTYNYSTKPSSRDPSTPRDDPTLEPPRLSGSFMNTLKPVYRDKDDKLIINAAREPYNPPIQKETAMDTLKMSFNTWFINLNQRAQAINRVNSEAMWLLQKRQIKLARWDWDIMHVGMMKYIRNDMEWHINTVVHPATNCQEIEDPIGWYDSLPNTGYSFLNADDKQEDITEADMPKKEPSYLDCDGHVVPPGDPETWNVFAVELEYNFLTIQGITQVLPGQFI